MKSKVTGAVRLLLRPAVAVGLLLVAVLLVAALGAPWLAPYDPFRTNPSQVFLPPAWAEGGSTSSLLGTDQLGRDLLSRMLYGARTSLSIAGGAVLLATSFGALVGLVAGYFKGRTDTVLMRLVDVQLAFPFILLALAILSLVEARGIAVMALVLAIAGWVTHARVARGRVLVEREKEYVKAAKALGAGHLRIMLLYILPVVLPTLLVIALLELAALMVAESIMAFVGLGIQPPGLSWGTILADGRDNLIIAPWMAILPGAAIFVSVLGVNLVADGLADVLDPRLRGGKLLRRARTSPPRSRTPEPYIAGDKARSNAASVSEGLLSVRDLRVEFPRSEGPDVGGTVTAVRDVSFRVDKGERLGIVGESGSGKSVTGLSIMGLLEPPGRVTNGSINFKGKELLGLSQRQMNEVRGGEIAMIFQDPSSSLNPTLTVAYQITEVISRHQRVNRKVARQRAIDVLRMVNINDPERVANSYPFELSGGMQQRVMIATALSCNPDLLIADEPTTALDVTTQAQILRELDNLVKQFDTSVVLITHDLGVVAEFTDRVVVMRNGAVCESGPTEKIIKDPQHPYTKQLLEAVVELEEPEGQRT